MSKTSDVWNLLVLTVVFVGGTMLFGILWALLLEKGVKGEGFFRSVVRMALLIIFAAVVLMPIYVVLVTSFKSPADFSVAGAWELPTRLSFDGWAAAWDAVAPALGRSLVLGIASAVISSFLGAMNGFVFFTWKFPGADILFTMFLFGMFIPYQAVMIPLQQLIHEHLDAVPVRHPDVLEAARVDGAGMWKNFTSIVLPVSAPAFVVTLIWQFTSAWNDFLFALFLTDRNSGPVTYALQELASAQNPDYSRMMAGVLVASLPTLIVYILLGRYFVAGLMSGSVK